MSCMRCLDMQCIIRGPPAHSPGGCAVSGVQERGAQVQELASGYLNTCSDAASRQVVRCQAKCRRTTCGKTEQLDNQQASQQHSKMARQWRRRGWHLLGRTQEVSAPTGLPRAMESAARRPATLPACNPPAHEERTGGSPAACCRLRHSAVFLVGHTPMRRVRRPSQRCGQSPSTHHMTTDKVQLRGTHNSGVTIRALTLGCLDNDKSSTHPPQCRHHEANDCRASRDQ
jgi:hypothetical protein